MTTTYHSLLGLATPDDQLKWLSYEQILAQYQDYKGMGAEYVRIDLRWHNLQTGVDSNSNVVLDDENNNSPWTEIAMVEKMVSAAKEARLEIIGIMGGHNYTGQDLQFQNVTTAERYGDFAEAIAQRFEDQILVWEILNEPNKDGIRPEDYVDVLKSGYEGIKSVSKDMVVLFGGNAPSPTPTPYHAQAYQNGFWGSVDKPEYPAIDFLKAVYDAGAEEFFDALAFHPYSWPLLPSETQSYNGWSIMESELREIMIENGDAGKQIWLTEMGVPTSGSSVVNETLLVDTLHEVVDFSNAADWIGPVIWYTYQDRPLGDGNTESFFGLVDLNGNRKDAYYEFSGLAQAQNTLYGNELFIEGTVVDNNSVTSSDEDPDEVVTRHGTEGDDILNGSADSEMIYGHSGNDAINGDAGDDTIKGGWGHDTINGGAGNDILYGEGGNDFFVIDTQSGRDLIADFSVGDKINLSSIDANLNIDGFQVFELIGSNWLTGAGQLGVYSDGTDTYIHARVSADHTQDVHIKLAGLHNLNADNFIFGTPTPSAIHGSEASDLIQGTENDDVIYGHSGNDVINGNAGDDKIKGGWGHDTINGGAGNDILYGEGGNNFFIINPQSGTDRIADFSAGDKIDLSSIDANHILSGDQEFDFIFSNWLTKPEQVGVYQNLDNNMTYVVGKTSYGSGIAFTVELDGLHDLTANDFIL